MLADLGCIAKYFSALHLCKRLGEGVFIQFSLLPFQVKKQMV